MDTQVKLREDSPRVRACPNCGRLVWNTCHHDGDDVRCKDMPVTEALKLLKSTISEYYIDLDACARDLLAIAELLEKHLTPQP